MTAEGTLRYLIVGGGVAGTTAAEKIRTLDPAGVITVATDEALPFYARIRLAEYLSGGVTAEELRLKRPEWYRDKGIDLLLGTAVTDIDGAKREAVSGSGQRLPYDRLLLATGGLSVVPPIAGSGKAGVFTLRTIEDARRIREHAAKAKSVLVIGGGLLGLEAASHIEKTGARVAVVEVFPRLLPRQLDPEGASMLRRALEGRGLEFHLGVNVQEVLGGEHIEGVRLGSGRVLPCDMALISAGVRPNAVLARRLGLTVRKGVVVDDHLRTGLPDVYAAGDLAEHRGTCHGIWAAAQKQGEVAGINMAGGDVVYEGTVPSTMLKVAGTDLVAVGDIDADGERPSIVWRDEARDSYRKLVVSGDVIVGAILYGDVRDARKVQKAVETGKSIAGMRESLERGDLSGL